MNTAIKNLVSNDVLRERIKNAKALIKSEISTYSTLVKNLKDAAKKKSDADRKYEKKQNEKNSAALGEATAAYDGAYAKASESLGKLLDYISALESDWQQLIMQIEILDPKSAPREKNDFEKYKKDMYNDKAKVDDSLAEAKIALVAKNSADDPNAVVAADVSEDPIVDASTSDDAVVEAAEAADDATESVSDTAADITEDVDDDAAEVPVTAEEQVPATETVAEAPAVSNARPARNIAPVSIDISSHVERVVSIAMDKLAGALEKRIDTYFASYVPNIPEGFGATGVGGIGAETASLQEKIAEDEKALLEKLVSIVEVLKKLNTDMATITATYASLDAKNKEVIELQRQSNDMQRHTLREQQGVQVNQRVINADQLKIAEDQVALTSVQKKAADEQARITSAQNALAESQKAIVETQASLEDAMKAIIQEQKRIITAQQGIVAENAKQVDAHKSIMAYQTEVSDAQKEILASQKQIAKDQKTTGERQKETSDLQKTVIEDVKEILKDQKSTKVKKTPAKPE